METESSDSEPHADKSAAQSEQSLILRVANLVRMLRDGMRELGLDDAINDAARAIPDAKDRLRYVASMTEEAANRVLTVAEKITPLQDALGERAGALEGRWKAAAAEGGERMVDERLASDTQAFLRVVREQSRTTAAYVMDIILAQGFQDLTGQVIGRMLEVVGAIETELIQVLVDHTRQTAGARESAGLVSGPQVSPTPGTQVVTSQNQVDDLLASLGL
ncbi:MAG: protein phosphatase CheZ [Candidimonas sp.]|nr:MAG: protein phosphatase CheZ [Candidimonas sp.]